MKTGNGSVRKDRLQGPEKSKLLNNTIKALVKFNDN